MGSVQGLGLCGQSFGLWSCKGSGISAGLEFRIQGLGALGASVKLMAGPSNQIIASLRYPELLRDWSQRVHVPNN